MIGRVIRIAGNTYEVRTPEGLLRCKFRGRLKKGRRDASQLAAVGDEVEATPLQEDEGAIEEVRPRRSKLSRPDPANRRREQIIVANVDAIVIVQSARHPDLDLLTVDRCTVMADAAGLPASLCINKSDLGPSPEADLYPALGIPVFRTAAVRGGGVEALAAHLLGRTSVLIGPSGVGKSSLVNALQSAVSVRTGAVSERTGGGRHTTSWVELVEIAVKTFVADTPGLEIFNLWEIAPAALRDHFPEFIDLAPRCKYRDCSHVAEPGCAVLKALASGAIAASRHTSYVQMRKTLVQNQVPPG